MDRKGVQDVLIAILVAVAIGGGIWLAATSSTAQGNRDFIKEQCALNLRQDHKLAQLVEAAEQNPTLVPAQRRVYSSYIQSVKKETCDI